jgi:cytosine/adenosine deaminase-related metal-dependent hydrolase
MILRPYGLVIDGRLEKGLEVLVREDTIVEVRTHTGNPEPYVVSPAFVNAHSHLEYHGMLGKLKSEEYWAWLSELVEWKQNESSVRVRQETISAAHENKRTGVALIAEHSDRPFAATGLLSAGIKGAIFQETITFFDRDKRLEKIESVRKKAWEQSKIWRQPIFLTPHAYFTVDEQTLRDFACNGEPFSIHVAETEHESQLTREATGPIAKFRRDAGFQDHATGKSVVQTLAELGLARPGAQFVHCCDVDAHDIAVMARAQVAVAHCPRSNIRLKCPPAPVREMLDAGIKIGLGLDSPASSGPIDVFDEMRAALRVSQERGRPLTPEEVWQMATNADALRFAIPNLEDWRIEPGRKTPMIKINVNGASTVVDLIRVGNPAKVHWV